MTDWQKKEAKQDAENFAAAQELVMIGFQQKLRELAGTDITAETTLEQIKRYSEAVEAISSWTAYYAEKLAKAENDE